MFLRFALALLGLSLLVQAAPIIAHDSDIGAHTAHGSEYDQYVYYNIICRLLSEDCLCHKRSY